MYANPDALGQALKVGEIDYADSLEANVFDSLADAPNISRLSAVYSGFNELAFNTGAALDTGKPIGDGNPLLKDKRLREAIGWSWTERPCWTRFSAVTVASVRPSYLRCTRACT